MAEPLKNQFGPDIPVRIATMISPVYPDFDADGFVARSLEGYGQLELTPRAIQIATTLRSFLPEDFPEAAQILLNSLGPTLEEQANPGMGPFIYSPHGFFIATFGLEHFELSMKLLYELTQRFTSEFSIRPFLETHRQATLGKLDQWVDDPSEHVRRLVSEGTRPRLPWAPRLRCFQEDPRPVLRLLERLKDDPSLYVRRSVANNLNDIGKDHPSLLNHTARNWLRDSTDDRRWLVRHALRSAIKRSDPEALEMLGYQPRPEVQVETVSIQPAAPTIGESLSIELTLVSTASRPQQLMVDFAIHYVKASGKSRPKVFKLKAIEAQPGAEVALRKKISLRNMTTRTHYPGLHRIDLIVNGESRPLGSFQLRSC